ncbi:hypothetical protein TcYC6_0003880 [Trypanosoma cruzi]|nr:hypothetical protein TcYC6_0003880 [Trypanosoma cruzi]
MLATVATHPQVSLGTQRILLMAAGTRRGKLGAWQPPGNSLSSKNRCWRQEEEEADHQLLQVPHGSGGRGAAAAQGHSSGNQGASLGTQQQVSGLRPPSLDEKQSGGTTECPPKPEEAPTLWYHAAYRLRGSRSNALVISGRSEDDTVTHRGGPCPEKVSVNTQQADAATAEEERRRENTDATRKTFMEVSGQHRRHHQSKCLRQLLATVTAAPQHRGLPVHSFTLLLVCAAAAAAMVAALA